MIVRNTLLLITFFLAGVTPADAAQERVLLDAHTGASSLELFSQYELEVSETDGQVVLSTFGDFYLIYPNKFSKDDFDQLLLDFKSNQPVTITILADISSSADYSFELQHLVPPSDSLNHHSQSLNHHLFQDVEDWAIKIAPTDLMNISADQPLVVSIERISLVRSNPLFQFNKDFWQVAPYSPATVNVLPTPTIFGRPGFYYFLPVFTLLITLLIASRRYRVHAFVGMLVLWMVFDARMTYELTAYAKKDYYSWVTPEVEEKKLRGYGDFYGFIEWVKETVPSETNTVQFIHPEHAHFPRIFDYFLYPVVVDEKSSVYVVYKRPDMLEALEGNIISQFDQGSFILEVQ